MFWGISYCYFPFTVILIAILHLPLSRINIVSVCAKQRGDMYMPVSVHIMLRECVHIHSLQVCIHFYVRPTSDSM